MTAHTPDPLYSAFLARFIADPKLANELVNGDCSWPPAGDDYGWDIWQLEERAVDFVRDAEEVTKLFPRPGRDDIWLTQLRAARDAIVHIRREHIERITAPDAFDDAPRRSSAARGWSRVL